MLFHESWRRMTEADLSTVVGPAHAAPLAAALLRRSPWFVAFAGLVPWVLLGSVAMVGAWAFVQAVEPARATLCFWLVWFLFAAVAHPAAAALRTRVLWSRAQRLPMADSAIVS